jgi:hypothetical protein
LTDASTLVDVLESIKLFRALVLDYPHLLETFPARVCTDMEKTHLAKGTLPDDTMEIKVVEVDLTVKVYWF